MLINVISHSKYRAPARHGDDIPLVLPGVAFGVFDGATDARGTVIDGVSAGRFAALTVAAAAAKLLAAEPARRMAGADLVAHLAACLRVATAALDLPIPPSTTVALAMDCGEDWRFLTLGDSGIRLNGTEVLCHPKILDDVSAHARIAIFRHLAAQTADLDAVEMATRRGIFLGLDRAVAEGLMPKALADTIIDNAARANDLGDHIGAVRAFLTEGICGQHALANRDDTPLGFDSMNGGTPRLGQMIDITRPKSAISSIEIYSDGYVALPQTVSGAAWEAAFAAAEAEDFHKIDRFACVKGSTSAEVFDDRTVVVLSGLTA